MKSWNIVIRILLYLPYDTHTRILRPLLDQVHIKISFIIRTYMKETMYNANTCIGYKLAFYGYPFDLNMYS